MSVRQQRVVMSGCRLVDVKRGRVETAGKYYVVTLELVCGHEVVGRLNRGRSMWGPGINEEGSINKRKAERWAALKQAHCLACGPP